MTRFKMFGLASVALLVFVVGCGKGHDDHDHDNDHDKHDSHEGHDHGADGHEAGKDPFAGMSADDVKMAKAQGICPVTDEALGSMGTPGKVMVGDRAVFICCPSCKKQLLNDPEKYLAKLAK